MTLIYLLLWLRALCNALLWHVTGSTSSPAPVATLLGNPPGKWNNHNYGEQQGAVNLDCIPLANSVVNNIGAYELTNPSEHLWHAVACT